MAVTLSRRLTWGRACGHVLMLVLVLGWAGSGCVEGWPPATPTKGEDGNVGLDPNAFPNQRIQGEPNDSFANPLEVVFDGDGLAHLAGTISSADDVDVYALGPLAAGDRIIVDVGTPDSNLDPMAVLFDETGSIVFENDDRDPDLRQYDSFINHVIRHDSSVYFLAIASAPLGLPSMASGAYDVLITMAYGGTVPVPLGQVVVLDFDGGTVTIPPSRVYNVGPFDAGDISPHYEGMTGQVRDQIVETMRENYDGLALDLRVVPPDAEPAGVDFSSIVFGGRASDAFGLAQQIDPYNEDRCDDAIIFTETFTPARFGRVLTAVELGTALGNVASHELGHLFGLNHVANVQDLMDTTGSAETFYADQDFITSPLDDTIFPLGVQNSLLWLIETLGEAG